MLYRKVASQVLFLAEIKHLGQFESMDMEDEAHCEAHDQHDTDDGETGGTGMVMEPPSLNPAFKNVSELPRFKWSCMSCSCPSFSSEAKDVETG